MGITIWDVVEMLVAAAIGVVIGLVIGNKLTDGAVARAAKAEREKNKASSKPA